MDGPVTTDAPQEWTMVDPDPLADAHQKWLDLITDAHGGSNHRTNTTTTFVPLARPLSECTMALITTAGAHLDDQEPFHVETTAGDATYRLIPDDVDLTRLRFTHTHYDTSSAEQDPNVVLPIDRLHAAVTAGRVGASSEVHIGMMGFNPDPTVIADETGPGVASILADHEVDVALLVPG